jgi:uncharacterized iron-regulated protein
VKINVKFDPRTVGGKRYLICKLLSIMSLSYVCLILLNNVVVFSLILSVSTGKASTKCVDVYKFSTVSPPLFNFLRIPISRETKVLMFGEHHTDQTVKRILIDNLTTLKLLGFTAIGVEAVKTNHQFELDEFFKGNRTVSEIEAIVRTDFQWQADVWASMFESARKNSIRIVALNAPSKDRNKWKNQGYGRFHPTEPVNFIDRSHPISWIGAT